MCISKIALKLVSFSSVKMLYGKKQFTKESNWLDNYNRYEMCLLCLN